jgi:hypothetical protein
MTKLPGAQTHLLMSFCLQSLPNAKPARRSRCRTELRYPQASLLELLAMLLIMIQSVTSCLSVIPQNVKLTVLTITQFVYEDASTFNGSRFMSESPSDPDIEESSTEQVKRQMVSLDTKYVLFGVGRHAW